MTAISKVGTETKPSRYLRPFDVRRDLEPVADLVELGFNSTLDDEGRRYLRHMRAAAKNMGFFSWMTMATERTSVPLSGYVWEQDGRVVGNASLIPYFIKGRRVYLIANVAVHPEYRRQGIARSLTQQAVQHARKRGAPSIWLHVRAENDLAVGLYQSLGFVERGRRTSWLSEPGFSPVQPPVGVRFASPRGRYWAMQRAWLMRSYPPELSWHTHLLEINLLRPGFWGAFLRWISGVQIRQWVAIRGGQLMVALSWRASSSRYNALWLAAPAEADEEVVHALLVHSRQRLGSQCSLTLEYPARFFRQAIQSAGFSARHTLIWMSLPLQ